MADAPELGGPVKLVILPRTLAGLDRAGLRQHLETVHGPMVVGAPDVSSRFVTYVHHYTQDLPAPAAVATLDDRDAITVIRFAAIEDVAASKANEAYRDTVGLDEDNFRGRDGSVALIARELEIVPGLDNASRKLFIFRTQTAVFPDEWVEILTSLAVKLGARGIATNVAGVVEGSFPYVQFDEIGLPDGADPALFVTPLSEAAASQFGDCASAYMLTQTVRFI